MPKRDEKLYRLSRVLKAIAELDTPELIYVQGRITDRLNNRDRSEEE